MINRLRCFELLGIESHRLTQYPSFIAIKLTVDFAQHTQYAVRHTSSPCITRDYCGPSTKLLAHRIFMPMHFPHSCGHPGVFSNGRLFQGPIHDSPSQPPQIAFIRCSRFTHKPLQRYPPPMPCRGARYVSFVHSTRVGYADKPRNGLIFDRNLRSKIAVTPVSNN